jgi:hypothetical protein
MWKAVGRDPGIFCKDPKDLLSKHQDTIEEIRLIQTDLITIRQLISISQRVHGSGAAWEEIKTRAVAERILLCKHVEGKPLFTAMLRLYAEAHSELRDSLQPEPQQMEPTEEFREQRRCKRNPSDDQVAVLKKTACTSGSISVKMSPTGSAPH